MTEPVALVFEGALTAAEHKGHIPIVFDVPTGVTRLRGAFEALPKRAPGADFDNLISLSVFGPRGARGARHNNPAMDFRIDRCQASPGYVAGPIEPGRWMVVLDTFRVLGPVQYRLTVSFDTVPVPEVLPREPVVRPGKGRGWYRGDLHAHTLHSDGSWDVPDLVAWARSRKLDFVTLSDHNTVSGHAQLLALATDDLLTMGGMELTTHSGHALSLGRREWHEWRSGPVTGKSMPMLADDIMATGALFVIAHPMSPGDPQCTGCRWEFQDMMPGPARIVEVWNGGEWSDYNEGGLALYRHWLSEGRRLVASAGSDIHGRDPLPEQVGFNHVDCEDLTEEAVLAAVRAGRNYLSSGPRLVLTASDAEKAAISMGSEVSRSGTARISWATEQSDLSLRVIGPGGLLTSTRVAAKSTGELVLEALPDVFVMAELRDDTGRVHALTNPIFVS